MNSFNERLKQAMTLKKITQSELCEKTGIPKSAMSQYVSGAFTPKQERTYLIAKALNINESWLLGYDDVSMDRASVVVPKIPFSMDNMEPVPLVGAVAAGQGCFADDNISEYIPTDRDILKEGYEHFWLEVKGDSMEPELHEKDLVLVRKQDTLDKECFAVVNVDAEDGVVKLVNIETERITLTSLNRYYPPRVFVREEMNRVRLIGPVLEVKRRFM